MRLYHYSIHTERAYCDWIKRYVLHHRMASREDLKDGEKKITEFLTHLAVEGAGCPLDPEPGHECAGFSLQKGFARAPGWGDQCSSRPEKGQRPRGDDPGGGGQGYPFFKRRAAACRQAAIRKRPAHDGGPSDEGAGYRFSNENDHCALRQGRQRSRNDLPCFGRAALTNPPGAGQSDT